MLLAEILRQLGIGHQVKPHQLHGWLLKSIGSPRCVLRDGRFAAPQDEVCSFMPSETIPHAEERPKGRVSKHAWPLCPTDSGLTGRECRCCFGGTRQSEETGENRSVRHLSGDFAPRLDYRRYGAGAKARRDPASVAPGQPGE